MSAAISNEERQETSANGQNGSPARVVAPEVNIFETEDGYVLEAEVPGVSKDGLEITVDNTTLTIVARRAKTAVAGEAVYRESTDADYRRVFELDPAIDTAKINAKVEQGVLTVHLPKSERAKPRKVTIGD